MPGATDEVAGDEALVLLATDFSLRTATRHRITPSGALDC